MERVRGTIFRNNYLNFKKLENERKQLLIELNNINKRKDNELLNAIEFHYYSKSNTNISFIDLSYKVNFSSNTSSYFTFNLISL